VNDLLRIIRIEPRFFRADAEAEMSYRVGKFLADLLCPEPEVALGSVVVTEMNWTDSVERKEVGVVEELKCFLACQLAGVDQVRWIPPVMACDGTCVDRVPQFRREAKKVGHGSFLYRWDSGRDHMFWYAAGLSAGSEFRRPERSLRPNVIGGSF